MGYGSAKHICPSMYVRPPFSRVIRPLLIVMQASGLDMSWHDERAYKTADYMMNAAAAAAATSTSLTVMKEVHKKEGKDEGKEEHKEERKEERTAGSSGHGSTTTTTTRGSVAVLDMTAWLKSGTGSPTSAGKGKKTGFRSGTGTGTGMGTDTETGTVTWAGGGMLGGAGAGDEAGGGTEGGGGVEPSDLAPVLGTTGLAPVRVLEWKELDESKVTEANLV